jgi:hypothetical protein
VKNLIDALVQLPSLRPLAEMTSATPRRTITPMVIELFLGL